MTERRVAYPLNPRLELPTSVGRGAAAAVATAMSCNRGPVLAHHLAWAVTASCGVRVMPGRRIDDEDPEVVALINDVRAIVGPIDAWAVQRRRQAHRRAFLVLAFSAQRPVAFVKSVPDQDAAGLATERRCLHALSGRDDAPLLVPSVLGHGHTATLAWTAMTPLPPRPHRPYWNASVHSVIAWMQRNLAVALERESVPEHWRPMHGDFAPWNLRRLLWGGPMLIDFEDAQYAPPEADVVFWNITSATLRQRPVRQALARESIEFWRQQLQRRLSGQAEPELDHRLLATLEAAPIRD